MKTFVREHSLKSVLFLVVLAAVCLLFASMKVKRLEKESSRLLARVIEQDGEPAINCSALNQLLHWYDYFPEELGLIRNWAWLASMRSSTGMCVSSTEVILERLKASEAMFIRRGFAKDLIVLYDSLGSSIQAAGLLKRSLEVHRAPEAAVLRLIESWLRDGMDPHHLIVPSFPGIYYWSKLLREELPELGQKHRESLAELQEMALDRFKTDRHGEKIERFKDAETLLALEPYLYTEHARQTLLSLLPDRYLPFPASAKPLPGVQGFTFEDVSPELSSLSFWGNRQEFVLNASYVSFGIFVKEPACAIISIGIQTPKQAGQTYKLYQSADNASWSFVQNCQMNASRYLQCGPFKKTGPYVKVHYSAAKKGADVKTSPYLARFFSVDESLCD